MALISWFCVSTLTGFALAAAAARATPRRPGQWPSVNELTEETGVVGLPVLPGLDAAGKRAA